MARDITPLKGQGGWLSEPAARPGERPMGLAGRVMVPSLEELRFGQRMSRTPLWIGLNWSGQFLGPGVSFQPGVMGGKPVPGLLMTGL